MAAPSAEYEMMSDLQLWANGEGGNDPEANLDPDSGILAAEIDYRAELDRDNIIKAKDFGRFLVMFMYSGNEDFSPCYTDIEENLCVRNVFFAAAVRKLDLLLARVKNPDLERAFKVSLFLPFNIKFWK